MMNGPVPPLPLLLSKPAKKRPLVSLTPLIDVVFILLIFFMLATSFLDWRAIDLSAPVQAAAGPSAEGDALLIEILPNELRFASEPVSLDALTARVAERVADAPEQRVVIKPSTGVPLQRTVAVLDRVKAAGPSDVTLIRGAEPSGE
ncbi:ExbD/TolR family protein [Pelagibius sp.]|uniref:ExbD/TolR family protein n=1 Tax=Pelagibius sp. TaxID=1931238 RepID=UPI003BAF5B75